MFLFGHRWQTHLTHAVHRDPRLVRRWVAGECPISAVVSERIEQLVRDKHSDQMRWTRAAYLNMIAGLSDTAIRGRLLAMDLGELQVDDQLSERRQGSISLILTGRGTLVIPGRKALQERGR